MFLDFAAAFLQGLEVLLEVALPLVDLLLQEADILLDITLAVGNIRLEFGHGLIQTQADLVLALAQLSQQFFIALLGQGLSVFPDFQNVATDIALSFAQGFLPGIDSPLGFQG